MEEFNFIELPSIRPYIDLTTKDIKTPKYADYKIFWLYGCWWIKGGYNYSGIYFGVPKQKEETATIIYLMGKLTFNISAQVIEHSKNRDRLTLVSKALKCWWQEVEEKDLIQWSPYMLAGVMDVAANKRGNDVSITCKKDKGASLVRYIEELDRPFIVYERSDKNSMDITLKEYHTKWQDIQYIMTSTFDYLLSQEQ